MPRRAGRQAKNAQSQSQRKNATHTQRHPRNIPEKKSMVVRCGAGSPLYVDQRDKMDLLALWLVCTLPEVFLYVCVCVCVRFFLSLCFTPSPFCLFTFDFEGPRFGWPVPVPPTSARVCCEAVLIMLFGASEVWVLCLAVRAPRVLPAHSGSSGCAV